MRAGTPCATPGCHPRTEALESEASTDMESSGWEVHPPSPRRTSTNLDAPSGYTSPTLQLEETQRARRLGVFTVAAPKGLGLHFKHFLHLLALPASASILSVLGIGFRLMSSGYEPRVFLHGLSYSSQ